MSKVNKTSGSDHPIQSPATAALAPPIYPATVYACESPQQAAELLAGLESVNNRLEAEASATRESFAQNELSGATLRLSDQAAVDDMHQQLQAERVRLPPLSLGLHTTPLLWRFGRA